jgi:hypothetical protein
MSKRDDEPVQEQQQQTLDFKQQILQPSKMSAASTQAVASIASYCLANMAMTVTNKYVFSVRLPFSCLSILC